MQPRSSIFMLQLLSLAVLGHTLGSSAAAQSQCPIATNQTMLEQPGFRFWVDYQAFIRNDSNRLFEDALQALGGCRVGPVPVTQEELDEGDGSAVDGFTSRASWDVYISGVRQTMVASLRLRPGQLVCYLAGSTAVAYKSNLVLTLQAHYGHATAASIVPRSFKLPGERQQWREWMQQHSEQDTGFWLLKNDEHRAEGIRLVSTAEGYTASLAKLSDGQLPWKLAQQYIANPLLLGGRKFGTRLHVFVPPGLDSFRVYVHKRGLVNLSEKKYDKDISSTMPSQASGHFTNQIVQRELWESWQLDRMRQTLGDAAFKLVWDSMTNSTAYIMAAVLSSIRTTTKRLRMPARSAFELFGIDFLVDDNMHVWVTEVNPGPSMRLPDDPDLHTVMKALKEPAVRDMFGMMRLKERQWDQPQAPVVSLDEVEAELQLRGDWLPLMRLYPQHTQQGLRSIPWSEADKQLQAWLTDSPVYQQAIADWYP